MSDAPEKIRTNAAGNAIVTPHPVWDTDVEYIRADHVDALKPVTHGPNWEGFARDLMEHWPVRDVDGSELFDAALRNGLIQEIPGGYDPEQHIDAECVCPEKGDPWYEYAFK
jgi:hypothetical protein